MHPFCHHLVLTDCVCRMVTMTLRCIISETQRDIGGRS